MCYYIGICVFYKRKIMQDFFLKPEYFKYINLFSGVRDFDDFALIKLCKTAVDNQLGSISVSDKYVENVWKWLELSDVLLNAVINNFNGKISIDDIFKSIKSLFNRGADLVEVILPPLFFDVDIENIPQQLDEYLLAISEAKGVKKVKLSIESSFIKHSSALKGLVYLFSEYKIDYLKTASGLYSLNSDINQLNAILEEAKSSDVGVDFMFDRTSQNKFIIDDAFRLANFILGSDSVDEKKFSVSCSLQDFQGILGKSTC